MIRLTQFLRENKANRGLGLGRVRVQSIGFIDACIADEGRMSEVRRRFEISRKIDYTWLGRFMETCELGHRSRRPKTKTSFKRSNCPTSLGPPAAG